MKVNIILKIKLDTITIGTKIPKLLDEKDLNPLIITNKKLKA
jgi:hypothetical protein